MDSRLTGKTALVVGASSGMGYATAVALADAGARVIACARREEELARLAQDIRNSGGNAAIHTLDVCDQTAVESVFAQIKEEQGGIDTMVYAAGTNVPGRALDRLSAADWHTLIETNLTGAFYCTQAALSVMASAGDGLIIYISSISAKRGDMSGVAYQASKRGIDGLVHGAMEELQGGDVRFSVIYPGLCDTPLIDNRPTPPSADDRAKALRPQDVADACLYIVSTPTSVHIPELVIMPKAPLK